MPEYTREEMVEFAKEVEVYYFNGKSFNEAMACVKLDWSKRENKGRTRT